MDQRPSFMPNVRISQGRTALRHGNKGTNKSRPLFKVANKAKGPGGPFPAVRMLRVGPQGCRSAY
jgi:hypothetical protein